MRTKKKAKKTETALLMATPPVTLSERIEKLRAECDRALDEEAEKQRGILPAVSLKAMFMARGAGSVFEAALFALKGK